MDMDTVGVDTSIHEAELDGVLVGPLGIDAGSEPGAIDQAWRALHMLGLLESRLETVANHALGAVLQPLLAKVAAAHTLKATGPHKCRRPSVCTILPALNSFLTVVWERWSGGNPKIGMLLGRLLWPTIVNSIIRDFDADSPDDSEALESFEELWTKHFRVQGRELSMHTLMLLQERLMCEDWRATPRQERSALAEQNCRNSQTPADPSPVPAKVHREPLSMERRENDAAIRVRRVCPTHAPAPGPLLVGKVGENRQLGLHSHTRGIDAFNGNRPDVGNPGGGQRSQAAKLLVYNDA